MSYPCVGLYGMQPDRFLDCLATDAARLREVAGRDLSAPVPSCPEWTAADLVRHVAEVYLHKTETMRRGQWPRPWPPDLAGESPLPALDRAYAALLAEFAARAPAESTLTWYPPEQTVGFWIRRMAQETVIHRVDAELAAGEGIAPIPDDLAVDGIDEVLVRFLCYGSTAWTEDFGDALADCDGRAVLVRADGRSWLVRPTTTGVEVTPGGDGGSADAAVSGAPADVLLWLWRRADDAAVHVDGDPTAVVNVRQLLGYATQ